jgi:hypothetical protein
MIFVPVLLAAAMASAHAGGPACIDPATPLRQLAAQYDRWPAPSTERGERAFELAKEYLAKGDPKVYHKALAEYRWIETNTPSDLHINFALGLLYATGPDLNFPGSVGYRHNAIANNSLADDRAADKLEFVASKDPSAWIAAVALTRIALVSPEKSRMRQARQALETVLQRDSTNVPARLAWHDVLIAQDSAERARAYDVAYPIDCTAAQHAQAESLLLTGDTAAGVRLYLAALRDANGDEVTRFYDDLRVMMSIGQMKTYAMLAPSERAAWMLAFWKRSADAFGRTIEARIAEHVVRVAFADLNFRARDFTASSDKPVAWIDDTTHIVPWDVRGVLYVRHGAPTHRFRIVNQCVESYEAWEYTAEDTPWIFWFGRNCLIPIRSVARTTHDWFAMGSPPSCGRPFITRPVPTLAESRAKLEKNPELIDRRDIYTLLSEFDPRYNIMLEECAKLGMGFRPSEIAAKKMQDLRYVLNRETQNILKDAVWSEGTPPRITKPANMVIAAYQFRSAQQRTELAVTAWLSMPHEAPAAPAARGVHFTYVLTDSDISAFRADKTERMDSQGGLLRSSATLNDVKIRQGTLRVIATNVADSTQGAVRSAPVSIRDDAAPRGLSDIVLAAPNTDDGVLERGTYRIAPLPAHVVGVGGEFRLFVEAYGIASGEDIETTVRIARQDKSALVQLFKMFPGKKAERTLSFRANAALDARGVFVEDVNIAGDLVPGDYMVQVIIQPKTGQPLERTTVLYITDGKGR